MKAYNERVARWQQLTIAQLSFTNNLFLGLNLGFLGFFITQNKLSADCACWIFVIKVLAILGLGVSFFTGVYLVVNRLRDFRSTTALVRRREKKFKIKQGLESGNLVSIESEISTLKKKTTQLGIKTWILLNWQIWSFAIGITELR